MFYKLQYLCLNTRKMRYPKYLETFSYNRNVHSYPTRTRNNIHLNNPKLLLAHKSLIPPSHLFRISKNQAEPAGMKNFQNLRHIREGISNPVTGGMEIIYIFLDMQFGGILNYVRTHSRANRDVQAEFEPHSSGNRKIPTTFELHSS